MTDQAQRDELIQRLLEALFWNSLEEQIMICTRMLSVEDLRYLVEYQEAVEENRHRNKLEHERQRAAKRSKRRK